MRPFAGHSISSSIKHPGVDQIRARKVISRSNYGHVYKFASIKCARIIELESGLEYDQAIIHEFDHSVVYFQEQPFALEYADENKIKVIYPDFLVYRDDGSMTIEEVKPLSKLDIPKTKRRFELEKNALEQHGYEFVVSTELEIRSGLRLENSRKLLPYRRSPVSAILRENVISALQIRELPACELIQLVHCLNYDLLLSLLAQSYISTDLSQPLNLKTVYFTQNRQSQLSQQQLQVFRRRCI